MLYSIDIVNVCQEIKTLIKNIFIAHQEAEEIVDTSPIKAREAVIALREMIKETDIAPLQIKYSGNNIISSLSYQNKSIVWSKEHGLGMQSQSNNTPSTVEPFVIAEGDYKVEDLVRNIRHQLRSTLNTIQSRNKKRQDYISKRNNELEQLINCLRKND